MLKRFKYWWAVLAFVVFAALVVLTTPWEEQPASTFRPPVRVPTPETEVEILAIETMPSGSDTVSPVVSPHWIVGVIVASWDHGATISGVDIAFQYGPIAGVTCDWLERPSWTGPTCEVVIQYRTHEDRFDLTLTQAKLLEVRYGELTFWIDMDPDEDEISLRASMADMEPNR